MLIHTHYHDALPGYVADEHIDHTAVSISAGGILSGGGTIAANRTISLANGDIDHDQLANFDSNEHYVQSAIVATGALNSGSITSEFGSIDVGDDTITTTGLGTFGSLIVDTDTLVVDGTNHRVGIGTNTPDEALDVAGIVKIGVSSGYFYIMPNQAGAATYRAYVLNLALETRNTTEDILFRTNNSGTILMTVKGTGNVGISETAPETLLEMTSNAPYLTLHNDTEEDGDGGGESRIIFKREDGAGTETAAGQIEVSHDGAGANDQLGKMVLSVNTGAGLVAAQTIDSAANITMSQNLALNGTLTNPTDTTFTITSTKANGAGNEAFRFISDINTAEASIDHQFEYASWGYTDAGSAYVEQMRFVFDGLVGVIGPGIEFDRGFGVWRGSIGYASTPGTLTTGFKFGETVLGIRIGGDNSYQLGPATWSVEGGSLFRFRNIVGAGINPTATPLWKFTSNTTKTSGLYFEVDNNGMSLFSVDYAGVTQLIDLTVDNTATITGILRADGGLGVGTDPGIANPILAHTTTRNGSYQIRVDNTNGGVSALARFKANSDTGSINMTAHGSGRTETRWGGSLGGTFELLAIGGPLCIGTLGVNNLILGTEEKVAITIIGSSREVTIEEGLLVKDDLAVLGFTTLGNTAIIGITTMGDDGTINYTRVSATGTITQFGSATATLLQLKVTNNVGFYGTTPVAQNQLATGAGASVDDVITELQNLGLVRQAA